MAGSIGLLIFVLKPWLPPGYFTSAIQKFRKQRRSQINRKNSNQNAFSRKTVSAAQAKTSYEKGLAFEKYVTTLFHKKDGFQLVDWRGDKFNKGIYALSIQYPDLEYRFKAGSEQYHFAIECKWRSTFSKGAIQLGEDYQLENYKQFAREKRMPVYILLGVGGSPPGPAELFVIPLSDLPSVYVVRQQIMQFKKANIYQPFHIYHNRLTFK
jgi:hypothetical protein